MSTTWSGIGRFLGVTGLCLALALGGCVSNTEFTRPGLDPSQMEADSKDCAQAGPVVVGALSGAAMGAVWGAGASASGASDGAAAAMGLAIGTIFGLLAGFIDAGNGEEYDRCMIAKGYHPA